MSKQCLINQPLGLGDILWVQAIVDKYVDLGYEVVYPVGDIYYDMVSEQIIKPGVTWHKLSEDFPMKAVMNVTNRMEAGDQLYVPVNVATYHSNAPLMLAKYDFDGMALPDDYRDHFEIKRDLEREQKLIDTYGLHGDYIIVNEYFSTPPTTIKHTINVEADCHVHHMDVLQDNEYGFRLFDWIGALQGAKSIHTVGTAICYVIDKYCDNDMHLYERRGDGQPRTFHREVEGVYKNPRWVYED